MKSACMYILFIACPWRILVITLICDSSFIGVACMQISLRDNEYVIEVSGTVDTYSEYSVVSALKIVTNLRTYGPYGKWSGATFSLPVLRGSAIVGLFARSGGYLDAIGVVVRLLALRCRIA